MEERKTTVEVSTLSILKVIFVLLLAWFLFSIREILLLILISVIISSAMDPLVDYLKKRRIPRGLSVLLVYIVFLSVLGLIIYLLIPPIAQQAGQIAESDFIDKINSNLGKYRAQLEQYGIIENIENNVREWAGNLSTTLFRATQGIFTGLISTLTVLVISFYLTAEENGMKNLVKNLSPYKHQAYLMSLVNKIQKKMGYWVLGQIILSVIIFGLTFLGLTILKVDFALVLALIAGVLEIIPIIGPFIALIPAVFFAFLQNPPLALAVLVLYIVIQQLENHVIVPVVMSKSVGLNPILVIVGILVGGTLGGWIGAVIAIPIISSISIFLSDIWEQQET
ncbi:MAG TPA: AI-2E family transporter [Verrucomicrobiae bacterium]|nr:AI-2E family transporter [Verrucomicrobiae bacterium]